MLTAQYNFIEHSDVTIKNLTDFISNQTLTVCGHRGTRMKTISNKNSIYTNERTFLDTKNLCAVVDISTILNPLKL